MRSMAQGAQIVCFSDKYLLCPHDFTLTAPATVRATKKKIGLESALIVTAIYAEKLLFILTREKKWLVEAPIPMVCRFHTTFQRLVCFSRTPCHERHSLQLRGVSRFPVWGGRMAAYTT